MKHEPIIEISPEVISGIRGFFSRQKTVSAFLLIVVLGTLAYWKSFRADFQFDDYATIVDNPLMKRLDLSVLWGHYKERFLTSLTFVFNYLIGGLNVFGWHCVNYAIHIGASVIVFHLTFLTFQTPRLKNMWDSRASYPIALATALLFLTHPLQTQAVTYIVQRATCLSGLFYLATVYFYARGRLYNRRKDYLWAVALCLLGILTKPTVITLPLAVVLYDFIFFRPERTGQFDKLFLWVVLALSVAVIPLVLLGGTMLTQEASLGYLQTSMGQYALTQLNVVVTYLRLFFFPVGQNLDYDYPISENLFHFPTNVSCVVVLGLLILALRSLRGRRYVTFGIFWFLITLGPQSSIFALLDVIVEHRVYLANFGICFVVSAALFEALKSFRAYLGVMAVVVVILTTTTYQRNALWSDAVKFMEDVVAKSPQKARPHNNLGFFYFRQGRLLEAESEYKKAIQSDPNYTIAYHNLAMVYFDRGETTKAKRIFEQLVEQFPAYADPHVGLANIFRDGGDCERAIDFYRKAVKANPLSSAAYVGLGNCFQERGDLADAVSHYQKAIWLNPDSASAYYNLGNTYFWQGQFYPALTSYQKAAKLRPGFAGVHNNMGNIYYHFYDFDRALEQFRLAIRFDPTLAEGYLNLANTLHKVDYTATARVYAQIALELYRNQGRADIAEKIEKQIAAQN